MFSKATQYATAGMLLQKNEPQNLHIYTIINSHMHEDTPKQRECGCVPSLYEKLSLMNYYWKCRVAF